MKRPRKSAKAPRTGPSQRQLRAGELIRHALVDILREGGLHDAALAGASVTVTEVRLSPDLKHAICFVEPLGAGLADEGLVGAARSARAAEVVQALNRSARFLRGKLGRHIDLRFTPDLKFVRDDSFDEAQRMSALFNRPEVRRDLVAASEDPQDADAGDGRSSPVSESDTGEVARRAAPRRRRRAPSTAARSPSPVARGRT